MDTHVKVLGVLYLVLSGLGVLAALFLTLTLGSAAGIVGAAASAEDAAIAIPIIGITGMALVIVLLALSLPGLIAGWGLLNFRPWSRILGIVLAILNLFNIPFGTMLGIYALWVLLNKDTERLFSPVATPTA
ncbi:MAG: hypothetical protein WBC51_12440 [Vicinamibacterales bacterium]|jgi:hypothetical protein